MNSTGQISGHPNPTATNLGIGVVLAIPVVAGILRTAGSLTAWLSGRPQPSDGLAAGLGVLATPSDPGTPLGATDLNPVLYWSTVAAMATVLAGLAWSA